MNSLKSATLKNVPRLLGRNSQGKSVRDTIWPNLQSLGGEEGWDGGGFRLSKLKCWKLYRPPCLCLLEYNIDTAPLSHMASVFHKAGREMQFCRIRTSIFFSRAIMTSNMPESISPWTSDREIDNCDDHQKWEGLHLCGRSRHLADQAPALNTISLS